MTEIEKNLFKNENGLGHLVLVLVIVGIIGVAGIAGVRVYKNNNKTADNPAQKTSSKKYDDQRVDSKVLSDLKGTEENEQ